MINYLCTSPTPKLSGTDAVYNEIDFLKSKFDGTVTSLYPFSTPSSRYPILLYGVHNYRQISKLNKSHSVNHIFSPGLFHIPIVYRFKNPTVYNVVAGIQQKRLPPKSFLKKLDKIVVSNKRDAEFLKAKGCNKIEIIKTAIDCSKFSKHKLEQNQQLRLLMASAPWEMDQFKSKGIHLMMKALKKHKHLHISFLWRNVLPNHMRDLIKLYEVSDQVTFINEFVDVNEILKTVHGTILLSKDSSLVKAFPHSLIESITSGKPIILTKEIPMSDFIAEKQLGIVMKDFTLKALSESIYNFQDNYNEMAVGSYALKKDTFSLSKMQNAYASLYKSVLADAHSTALRSI